MNVDDPTASALSTAAPRFGARDLAELAKLRLTGLVLLTTMAGFYLGRNESTPHLLALHVLLGTGLVAAGAAILNQLLEIQPDGRMRRTRTRPLPAGRIREQQALLLGVLAAGLGIAWLAVTTTPLASLIATLTLLVYLALYTPLKRLSPLNTLVGAVPGALPPVIGWTAVRGSAGPEAWSLFALLFLWQMPHFLAIAWLYRDDYAAGGFRMLTLHDATGRSTGIKAAVYAALLLPATAWPWLLGIGGPVYLAGGLLAGAAYFVLALRMALRPETATARALFFASLLHLPVVMILLVADRAG